MSVFVSYKREETHHFVTRLRDFWRSHLDIRFDATVLIPARLWRHRIRNEIQRADTFAFVISPGSIEAFDATSSADECAREFRVAMQLGKPVVPILWQTSAKESLLPQTIRTLEHVSFDRYRRSEMTDERAFHAGCERLRVACHAIAIEWSDQAFGWYEFVERWDDNEQHLDFLLTRSEMRRFEAWLKAMPANMAHVLDHPLMWRFIRANKHAHDRSKSRNE